MVRPRAGEDVRVERALHLRARGAREWSVCEREREANSVVRQREREGSLWCVRLAMRWRCARLHLATLGRVLRPAPERRDTTLDDEAGEALRPMSSEVDRHTRAHRTAEEHNRQAAAIHSGAREGGVEAAIVHERLGVGEKRGSPRRHIRRPAVCQTHDVKFKDVRMSAVCQTYDVKFKDVEI